MFKEDVELWRKVMDARHIIEENHEWRKWGLNIPNLKFNSKWEVRIIPPFGGAVARFNIFYNEKWVSIYLDCYDELGYVGEPYWELFPNKEGDCSRYLMNNTEALMAEIQELMDGNNENDSEESVL